MIRLFQRDRHSARRELGEIQRVLRYLKSSPDQTGFVVGAGVCLANTDCLSQFGGMQSFRQNPLGGCEQFYAKLSDLELSLRSRELGMALRVGRYLIWRVEVLAE